MRECPQRPTGSITWPAESANVASAAGVQSAGRGRGAKGAASSSGTQNRTYALVDQLDAEASPDEGTGILPYFHMMYMY